MVPHVLPVIAQLKSKQREYMLVPAKINMYLSSVIAKVISTGKSNSEEYF